MIKVGLAGVTGYSGACLLELLLQNQNCDIAGLYSGQYSGKQLAAINPKYTGVDLPTLTSLDEVDWTNLDCLFTATPNGIASKLALKALTHNVKLIDLAADFRLQDPAIYADWYAPLEAPEESCLKEAVYGLTEFNRKAITSAKIVANPGCYPTASALGILPLLQNKLIDSSLCIIDAKSGATGAGKKAEESLLFSEVSESFSAYKVNKHRHTPEIEQSLNIFGGQKMNVRFTPHLLPMKRGILATIYLKPSSSSVINNQILNDCFQSVYSSEEFVHVVAEPPATKDVYATNNCHIYPFYDERTNTIEVISVIDNLMKGAAGQAMQNFELMFSTN